MPETSVRPDAPSRALPSDLTGALRDFFAGRAAGVDHAELDVRDGLRWLAARDLLGLELAAPAGSRAGPATRAATGELIALIAEECVASAFALWCHRMVLEYVAGTTETAYPRAATLDTLLAVNVLGSTALGTAMAHVVTGSPLTVTARQSGGDLILDGRIAWASNLLAAPGAAISVTAAVDEDGRRLVVALPLDAAGVQIAPYPNLLALQATRSSSVILDGVRVPGSAVLADDLRVCLGRIRPTFLALQASFCWGLARAALRGARAEMHGTDLALADDLTALETSLVELELRLRAALSAPDTRVQPMRSFVQTRYDLAQLAGAATRLELTVRGGRAYRIDDPAGRRFREAAFLPVQAPTEGQLRWELARSA